jgi:hypothetical protein
MSAVLSGPIYSTRLLAFVLIFACAGSLIQLAFEAILVICCVFVGFVWGAVVVASMGVVIFRFIWPISMLYAAQAGLAGLITGIYEMKFGRTRARVMLAISLIAALPGLALLYLSGHDAKVAWFVLGSDAIVLISFLASMMACWKITEVARDRDRATVAEGLSSP